MGNDYYVSSAAYAAVQTWTALTGGSATSVSTGVFCRQTSPSIGNERVFVCTTAGTTGTSEPSWNLNNNNTTTDGTVVWTEVAGQAAYQSAGNWTAPMARLEHPFTLLSVVTGDRIFVSSDHAQTQAGSITITISQYVPVLSVSRTGATLPPTNIDLSRGASVSITGNNSLFLQFQGCYVYGIDFVSGAGSDQGNLAVSTGGGSIGQCNYFDNCSLQLGGSNSNAYLGFGSGGSESPSICLNNTYLSFASSGQTIYISDAWEWKNTSSAVRGTVPTVFVTFTNSYGVTSTVYWHGLDLSAVNTSFFNYDDSFHGTVRLANCLLDSGVSVIKSGSGGLSALGPVLVDNCATSGGGNYKMTQYQQQGYVQDSESVVRTGGASDGSQLISHQYTTYYLNNNPWPTAPLQGPDIVQRYNTPLGSSQTVTMYGVYNGSAMPTNSQVWMDVEYLGTSGTSQSSIATSLNPWLATASNLSADTSTWSSGAPARANSTAYTLGQVIAVSSNSSRIFFCTSAGTSASSLPSGYASAVDGGSVTDGSATFTAGWRFSFSATFTPEVAGIVKVSAKCSISNMSGLFIDPLLNIS